VTVTYSDPYSEKVEIMANADETRRAAAERKRQERKRMYDQGYILRHVWVRPADWPRVQKYLSRVNSERG
jgi:hypothetical protein